MDVYWLQQFESDVPMDDSYLSDQETVHLERLRIPKRRAEWRLGRWTAKKTIAAYLGFEACPPALRRIEIQSAPSGAPVAFVSSVRARFEISLSHRAGCAMCAVAEGAQFGCDLELIETRSEAFAEDYFTPDEYTLTKCVPVEQRSALLTLLWSLKESALKASQEGLRVDTRSVEVTLEPAQFTRDGSATEWGTATARLSSGVSFSCLWSRDGDMVRTIGCSRIFTPVCLLREVSAAGCGIHS